MVRSKSNTTSFVWELETEGGSNGRSMAIVKSVQDRYEWLVSTSGALDWSSSVVRTSWSTCRLPAALRKMRSGLRPAEAR